MVGWQYTHEEEEEEEEEEKEVKCQQNQHERTYVRRQRCSILVKRTGWLDKGFLVKCCQSETAMRTSAEPTLFHPGYVQCSYQEGSMEICKRNVQDVSSELFKRF